MRGMTAGKESILSELVILSHHLGEEWRDYVVVGEGNTSARIDAETFWVKASGANLRTIDPTGFVQVNRQKVLGLLERNPSDEELSHLLAEASVPSQSAARPSIETVLHAALYELTDAAFIGHTHPIAVNIVLGSGRAPDITRHLIPDEIVVCGLHSVFVPYTDPGVPLTRAVQARVRAAMDQYGEAPRVIYLQNHGLFALGQSARQVENITAMAVKHARVLAGVFAIGEPQWLDEQAVSRLHSRPDEHVRRRQFQ